MEHDPSLRKSSDGFFLSYLRPSFVTEIGEIAMYKYFVQPIINKFNQSVIGYELLLKKLTEQGWRPPHSFADVPAEIVAGKLVEAASELSLKVSSLSVNLNRAQILNDQVVDALIKAQKIIRPTRIQVELTEDSTDQTILTKDISEVLKKFVASGIEVSLDDVDSGSNTEQQVQALIPLASEIKFALQNFDKSVYHPDMQQRVIFWRDFAKEHKVRFVLEGIEDKQIDKFIDTFNVDVRQGYFYEKPHLVATDAKQKLG